MVRRSKQVWEIGQTVKVGFLSLVVRAAVPTPGDHAPDAYVLSNAAGDKLYEFVPHNGLHRISTAEAADLLAKARAITESQRDAQAALERLQSVNALLNNALFGTVTP